jgi:ankyrin repeat protein
MIAIAAIIILFSGCDKQSSEVLSGEGENCTKTADCERGLKCIEFVCATQTPANPTPSNASPPQNPPTPVPSIVPAPPEPAKDTKPDWKQAMLADESLANPAPLVAPRISLEELDQRCEQLLREQMVVGRGQECDPSMILDSESTSAYCVDQFFTERPDIAIRYSDDSVLLHNAVARNSLAKVNVLIKHGVRVDNTGTFSWKDKTPLYVAVGEVYDMERACFVRLLTKHGAKLDKSNWGNYPPLHTALKNYQFKHEARYELLVSLIAAGASLESRDLMNRTALAYAIGNFGSFSWGLPDIALLMSYRYRANIHALDKWKNTLLHLAAANLPRRNNLSSVMAVLLKRGLDIEARNEYGQTPLISAAGYCNMTHVKYLLLQGADWSARDNKGLTALGSVPKSGLGRRNKECNELQHYLESIGAPL